MNIKMKKNYKCTLVRKCVYFEILCWKFLGQHGTCLCRQCSNQLWFAMISDARRLLNYKEGRKYV
jgi:hypothetical protein